MTFHLTGPVKADLPAVARPITEPEERRRVMEAVTRNWQAEDRFEIFYQRSPLVEVTFHAPPFAAIQTLRGAYSFTMSAVTIPNMPSSLSAWLSTWQWNAHTPSSLARMRRQPADPAPRAAVSSKYGCSSM